MFTEADVLLPKGLPPREPKDPELSIHRPQSAN